MRAVLWACGTAYLLDLLRRLIAYYLFLQYWAAYNEGWVDGARIFST